LAPCRTYTRPYIKIMTQEQPEYLSYLLRLRRVSGREALWRASLENPHTGGLHHFASLEEVFEFLQVQMGTTEPAASGAGAPDGAPDGGAKY
jgi:hypothetical protein